MYRIRFAVVLIVSLFLAIFTTHLHSQEVRHDKFFTVQSITLFSADGLVRLMDAESTHHLLSDPCHCFHELDPLAPPTGNRAALIPFQLGVTSVVILGSYLLHRSGHHRLERMLPSMDITMETVTYAHNRSLYPRSVHFYAPSAPTREQPIPVRVR